MKTFKLSGHVRYTMKMGERQAERESVHEFDRVIEAESAREAYNKIEKQLLRKYKERIGSRITHENIHISDCKIYEMVEVTEW